VRTGSSAVQTLVTPHNFGDTVRMILLHFNWHEWNLEMPLPR